MNCQNHNLEFQDMVCVCVHIITLYNIVLYICLYIQVQTQRLWIQCIQEDPCEHVLGKLQSVYRIYTVQYCVYIYTVYIYSYMSIYIYNQYLSDNQRLCVEISGPSTPIYASHQYPSVMLSPARRVIFFLAKISARGSLSIKPIFHGLFCQFYQVLQHRSSHK